MYSEATHYIHSPIGDLKIEFENDSLFSLSVMDELLVEDEIINTSSQQKINNKTLRLLKRYFTKPISFSDIPFIANGTDFQRSVWQELLQIPLGETRTYGEIAKRLKSGPRAVGNACRKNPIQIIIPCHRVVSASGIGGYSGETNGQEIIVKQWLLNHEGVEL